MKILFDYGTPKPIALVLKHHEVAFARQIGWHEYENGKLIEQAEAAGFHVLPSTDKNIRYQQNLKGRRIALVILGNSRWPLVKHHLATIAATVDTIQPGGYVEIDIPNQPPTGV